LWGLAWWVVWPKLGRMVKPYFSTFVASVLCLLALLLAATAAHAQWQWRTADGRVTMSDRPPPREVPDKDIIKRPAADSRRSLAPSGAAASAPAAAGAPASAPSTALEREVQAKKRAAELEQAAKTKAEDERVAAVRANNCRTARTQIAALESGIRIARSNDKGEREFLDDKARADEQRRAREVIASDCK
jgi:Domain of unknown function (DUF4124)